MKSIKILSLLMALIMLVGVFAACHSKSLQFTDVAM